jgi:hypothetical protein
MLRKHLQSSINLKLVDWNGAISLPCQLGFAKPTTCQQLLERPDLLGSDVSQSLERADLSESVEIDPSVVAWILCNPEDRATQQHAAQCVPIAVFFTYG